MPTKPFYDPEIDHLRSAIARRVERRRIALTLVVTIAALLIAACLGWRF